MSGLSITTFGLSFRVFVYPGGIILNFVISPTYNRIKQGVVIQENDLIHMQGVVIQENDLIHWHVD